MNVELVVVIAALAAVIVFLGWVFSPKAKPVELTEGDHIKQAKQFLAIPREHLDGSWYTYKVTLVPCEAPATQGQLATIGDPVQRRTQ